MSDQSISVSQPDGMPEKATMEWDIEVGQTGLKRLGGFVVEEFLKDLAGPRGIRIYREMLDNDATVGALIFAFDKLIRRVEWRVDPPKDATKQEEEVAEFVQECMTDMNTSFSDFVSEAASMLGYGWSYHEIVYKRRVGPDEEEGKFRSQYTDKRIGWRKFSVRSQDSLQQWSFDDDGSPKGMWQLAPPTFELTFIPIEKSLLFRTTAHKNNPEGKSILRNAYRSWYYKKRIEEIEAVGVERDLAGFPVLRVDPRIMKSDATTDQKQAFAAYQDIIVNIRRDQQEGLILPALYDPETNNPLYELTLLASAGNRQFDTNAIVERYDRRILMSVLADFILLGHEKVGSFALSSDKTDLFTFALAAVLDQIRDVLNTHAIPRLLKLNGIKNVRMPKFAYGDVEDIALGEIAQYIQILSTAGMPFFPNADLTDYLLERAHLPKPSEAETEQMEEAKNMQTEMQRAQVEAAKRPPEPQAPFGQKQTGNGKKPQPEVVGNEKGKF